MNTYQVIDEKNWERAMHCMVFRESVEPAFCVTFKADITNFRRKVKEHEFYSGGISKKSLHAMCQHIFGEFSHIITSCMCTPVKNNSFYHNA